MGWTIATSNFVIRFGYGHIMGIQNGEQVPSACPVCHPLFPFDNITTLPFGYIVKNP